jgi:DNA-3-methyladenine glycosylase
MPTRPRRFFARPADQLARALLGSRLVRTLPTGERIAGIIVETEAYLAPEDRASHAYKNRRTPRNEPMFMAPGTSYVYFTYGMHFCMNVSALALDKPHAVLIRALEPVEGLHLMRIHRAGSKNPQTLKERDLCSGPAKLCKALAIDRALTAIDMCSSDTLAIETGKKISDELIVASPRIGIANAAEWTSRPLRFSIRGNPHVSVPPPATSS